MHDDISILGRAIPPFSSTIMFFLRAEFVVKQPLDVQKAWRDLLPKNDPKSRNEPKTKTDEQQHQINLHWATSSPEDGPLAGRIIRVV